jgi:3-phenylpropionate/cinnamic acid dioxygenase small subunit
MAAIGNLSSAHAQAIEDLLYRSVWLLDHGQADRVPETLAPDGLVYGLAEDPMDHARFSAWARERAANASRKTRHLISNIRLSALPDGRVRGRSTLVVFAIDEGNAPELSFVGDQEDIFVQAADGQWTIFERRLVALGA